MSILSSNSCVLNLPIEVFKHRVLEYLTLKDAVHLDSAILQRKYRDNLLQIFRHTSIHNGSKHPLVLEAVNWISSRGLYLNVISLCNIAGDAEVANMLSFGNRCYDLSLAHCYNLSDTSASCVALNCPMLTHLDLHTCTGMSNIGITSIISRCTRLTTINLNGCRFIANSTISSIAQHCPNLRTLNLSACKQITDSSVTAIAAGCPHLEAIMLRATGVTDRGIEAISNYCPCLVHVDVSRCVNITDVSLITLGQKSIKLKSLLIFKCPRITDYGLIQLSELCPTLRSINARYCMGLSDIVFIALAQNCPQIRIL